MKLSESLNKNIITFKDIFLHCDDIIFREFYSGKNHDIPSLLLYADGMCDKDLLSDRVLEKIMASEFILPENEKRDVSEDYGRLSMSVTDCRVKYTSGELTSTVLSGNGALLVDGKDFYIEISSTKFPSRAISEPESKSVIRGPRDGFTENFLDSTSLLRRRIKSADFKMEFLTCGEISPSRVAVCYLKSEADKERLRSVKEKLCNLPRGIIIDSGQIQNALSGNKNRLFPTIQATERCDDAVFAIGEGKIVLLVENSPFVLIIPGLILSMLTSSEDYYSSASKKNAILFLRIVCAVTTVLLPALYIGFVKYNPDFLPDKIILMLAGSRKNVALPPFTEILFMQIVFEVIMEASIRLPGKVASAVGIVGSIVLGQAIVDANLVNIMVVIIVALNATLTFVIPSFELTKTMRLLRLIFMVVSSVLGIYGVCLSFVVLFMNLCGKYSFGAEYLFPFADNLHVRRTE